MLLFYSISFYGQQDESQKIITIVEDMWKAMEDNDVDSYMKYYHPDYTTFGEYDNFLREGKLSEKKSITRSLSKLEWIKTVMRDPKVSINGDTAWITYYWKDEGVYEGKPYASEGKSSRIFVKEKGKWLCIHSHFTLMPED